ncbi:hypothetical protein T492DRAFT_987866 [Pavlovales sp. CCMP2436]|nr:hypothetical protein T492DRAFT_987866 [Pavlovales sp. CCMP2436]
MGALAGGPVGLVGARPPALSSTVYSLATVDAAGEQNMNIVTYAMPASLPQSQVWAVSMFKGTVSEGTMRARRRGMLQILSESHADLVPILGKTSRRDVDKLARAVEMGHAIVQVKEAADDRSPEPLAHVPILAGCIGYLDLVVESIVPAGDHDLYMCRVLAYSPMGGTNSDGRFVSPPLTTAHLRARQLIG